MNDKHKDEIEYQKDWVKKFKTHKKIVLKYWQVYRYFNTILKVCKPNEHSKILDVGCGISTILHFLPGEKHGIDSLADIYFKLYKYPKDMKIVKADCEKLPYNNNYFDIIFCSNSFDHFDNLEQSSKEIYRVLKSKGFFVLSVEYFEKFKERNKAHPHCLSKKDIYKFIKSYRCLYQREIPWVGLREYVEDIRIADEKELLLILQKKEK